MCINLCVRLRLERAICIPQSGGEIARVLVCSHVNLSGVHTQLKNPGVIVAIVAKKVTTGIPEIAQLLARILVMSGHVLAMDANMLRRSRHRKACQKQRSKHWKRKPHI